MNSYTSLAEYIRKGKSKVERKIENNTYARFDHDNIVIRFHDTDIVEFQQDNTLTLNSGGYKTFTTKDRINKFLPDGIRLYQDTGLWWLSHNWQDKIPFCDEIVILPDGEITGYVDHSTKDIKLRKDIKKYAKGFVKALLSGKVERPNGGDCWNCYMREVETNKPLGEITNDTDHLLSHFQERYYVGSLLYRAIELYPMCQIANMGLYELWQNDAIPEKWYADILAENAYKSLVKYLYSQFNLPH